MARVTSVLSFPDRGPWGRASYRGNCSGHVVAALLDVYRPRFVVDPMEGSGTTRDVCRDRGVAYRGLDLREGFDLATMRLADRLPRPADLVAPPPCYIPLAAMQALERTATRAAQDPRGRAIVYPESDGRPVGETEWHVYGFAELLLVLRSRFSGRSDVHVGGNLLIYYREGDPKKCICPDLFVAFGAGPALRRVWKVWEEGFFPQVVIELVSDDSRGRDLTRKRRLYARLGVREYVVFDPTGETLPAPRLRGWRARGGRLVPVEPVASRPHTLRCTTLGLEVRVEGERLRLIDAVTGERLLFPDEESAARRRESAARRRESAARRRESAARRRAEAEAARLRAELRRIRRGRM